MTWLTRLSARLRASGSRGVSTSDAASAPPNHSEEHSNASPERDGVFSKEFVRLTLDGEELSVSNVEISATPAEPLDLRSASRAIVATEGSDMTDQPSAARQLDAIRNGSANMLLTIRHRINEATKALDDGEFTSAQQRLQEALQCIGPLAHSQAYLAIADTSRMIRAAGLESGMTMTGVGEITEVSTVECEHEDCPGHYVVTVAGFEQPVVLDGDNAVYVVVDNG